MLSAPAPCLPFSPGKMHCSVWFLKAWNAFEITQLRKKLYEIRRFTVLLRRQPVPGCIGDSAFGNTCDRRSGRINAIGGTVIGGTKTVRFGQE